MAKVTIYLHRSVQDHLDHLAENVLDMSRSETVEKMIRHVFNEGLQSDVFEADNYDDKLEEFEKRVEEYEEKMAPIWEREEEKEDESEDSEDEKEDESEEVDEEED